MAACHYVSPCVVHTDSCSWLTGTLNFISYSCVSAATTSHNVCCDNWCIDLGRQKRELGMMSYGKSVLARLAIVSHSHTLLTMCAYNMSTDRSWTVKHRRAQKQYILQLSQLLMCRKAQKASWNLRLGLIRCV